MASASKDLTKETLRSRAQVCVYEQQIKKVEVDSRTLSRLISLGAASGEDCFAKLFGYFDAQHSIVVIKDLIALPNLAEDEARRVPALEAKQKNVRANLGFQFACVGTFARSQSEAPIDERVCFYLSHFNVFNGFGLLLVFSAEAARSASATPLRAFVPSAEFSEAYKFKLDKELFEPDPAELARMLRGKKNFLRELQVDMHMSPVLELLLHRHQHQLRMRNPAPPAPLSDPVAHLESGLAQTVRGMADVLTSQRSLEMRRQRLLDLMGALSRTRRLLQLKRAKLKKDSAKLRDLGALAVAQD